MAFAYRSPVIKRRGLYPYQKLLVRIPDHRKLSHHVTLEAESPYSPECSKQLTACSKPLFSSRHSADWNCGGKWSCAPVRTKSTLTKPHENLTSVDINDKQHTSSISSLTDTGTVATSSTQPEISPAMFENYRVAFGCKSTLELLRALSFFYFCKYPYFTDNAVQVMEMCYKILGKRGAESLIRKTAYDQFVAGDSNKEIMAVVDALSRRGMGPMLAVPLETDIGVCNGSISLEQILDENLKKILDCIDLSQSIECSTPMFQYRFTALVSGDLLKTISNLCTETIHDQTVLDGIVSAMEGKDVDFTKLPGWENFPKEKTEECKRAMQRLGAVNERLKTFEGVALVDAEYTYLNPALRLFGLCSMKVLNRDVAKLFYTYQAYLKETASILESDIAFTKSNGICFGTKLVRGAYMVKERQLACQLGYEDPVNETFEKTCESYHTCLDMLLNEVPQRPPLSTRFIIASHNEETVRYAITRMQELGIPKDGDSVFFGQLYGMGDHVSFTLGHKGYRIYKSIPYGSISETVPYLARRAQENRAILLNARREKDLVLKTLKDRIMLRV